MKIKLIQTVAASLFLVFVAATTTSCSAFRKNKDGNGAGGTANTDSSVKSETTADGGTEKIMASPMNLSAQGSDSGSIDGLKTVFFEYDKSVLSSEENAKLSGNADWMKINSSVKLTIEGHCDQKGSNEYNLSLGERRANAIKKILQDMGVPSSRLTTVSFGEEKPLISTDDETAMSKNRRANFVPSN